MPGSITASCRQGASFGYEIAIATDAIHPSESNHLPSLRMRGVQKSTEEWLSPIRQLRPEERAITTSKTALLLVDIQNDALHPGGSDQQLGFGQLDKNERDMMLKNNKTLISAMRQNGLPIIYIQNEKRSDGLDNATAKQGRRLMPTLKYVEGTWGSQVVDEIKPEMGDLVVKKRGHSAFSFTPLHRILRNLNVGRCIVTGGAVRGCVADTVIEGAEMGYNFIVTSDATFRRARARLGLTDPTRPHSIAVSQVSRYSPL